MNATRKCTFNDCDRPHSGLGFCKMHYKRFKKYGDASVIGKPSGRPPVPVIDGCKKCGECHISKPLSEFYTKVRAVGVGTYSACKKCVNARSTRYAKDNAEAARISAYRSYRRAKSAGLQWRIFDASATRADKWNRLKGIPGLFVTEGQIEARFAAYGNACWMCGEPDAPSIDHVKPISKGGPHLASNIRPACISCNSAKADKWFGASGVSKFVKPKL